MTPDGDIGGAGVPDNWVHVRVFATRFGHGHTSGAARHWFRRQIDKGYVREWHTVDRDRYVTEDEIARFVERRATHHTLDD